MWLADKWKEYRLVDTAGGEKLEYWGDYLLRRPEPQAVWEELDDEKLWNDQKSQAHQRRLRDENQQNNRTNQFGWHHTEIMHSELGLQELFSSNRQRAKKIEMLPLQGNRRRGKEAGGIERR